MVVTIEGLKIISMSLCEFSFTIHETGRILKHFGAATSEGLVGNLITGNVNGILKS